MTVLITGGLGFIGLHTARAFLDQGESVVLTRYRSYRLPSFLEPELNKRVFIEAIDLNSPYDMIHACRKHHVTHICDLFVPRRGTLAPGEDYRVKMNGFFHVLETATICDIPKISHASSVAVYGSVREGPLREDIPLPMTSGNETEAFKKAEEVLGNHYADRTGLDITFLRIGGFYGPLYQRENRPTLKMIRAAMAGVPATYEGVLGGNPHEDDLTDACYVRDGGRAIALLTLARNLPSRAYNISAGTNVSNKQIAAAIKKVYPNSDPQLQPGAAPRRREEGTSMDLTFIKRDVGYEPEYDIDRGVGEWMEWLKTNEN
jgi:UDP-glucose 4-epimerase